jgi:hypothetical protein
VKTAIARVGEFLSTVGRQAIPLGGIFSEDWRPVTALAVYWIESLLLALVAVGLCALLKRRSSDAAVAAARADGDEASAQGLAAEQLQRRQAGVEPKDVAIFHLASFALFGVFFSLLMVILVSNGHITDPIAWSEIRGGGLAMLAIVGMGFLIDLWRFPSATVAGVQARVDACTARWALFWLVGFVGVGLMAFIGRVGFFLGFFGILKLTWEVWGTLANMFGWRSARDLQRTQPAR